MANPAYIDSVTGVLTDGPAWIALATSTVGSATPNVTFTNPNDGSSLDWGQCIDLVLLSCARTARSGAIGGLMCRINGATTDYKAQYCYGTGTGNLTAEFEDEATGMRMGSFPGAGATASFFGSSVTTFSDVNSGKWKITWAVGGTDQNGSGQCDQITTTATHQDTWPAITSLVILEINGSDNIAADSRFDLFGVLPRMVAA